MESSRKLSAALAFLMLAPFLLRGVRALASPLALAPGELGALPQPRSPRWSGLIFVFAECGHSLIIPRKGLS
jgi:hypothetical protein